jgi:hypothetical protein
MVECGLTPRPQNFTGGNCEVIMDMHDIPAIGWIMRGCGWLGGKVKSLWSQEPSKDQVTGNVIGSKTITTETKKIVREEWTGELPKRTKNPRKPRKPRPRKNNNKNPE